MKLNHPITERMKVTFDMMSPFQLAMLADIECAKLNRDREEEEEWFIGPIKPRVTSVVEKLIPNLRDKTRYILHYRNLSTALPVSR